MNGHAPQICGLTRVILESLIDLTPDVVENGEQWSNEMLDEIEKRVHAHLSPKGSQREQLLFDMLFKRSFAEARSLLMEVLPMQSVKRSLIYDQSARQATA